MVQTATCHGCGSARLAEISGQVNDLCEFGFGENYYAGLVPEGVGVERAYYAFLEFTYCLDCGRIQGNFPVPQESVDAVFQKK